MSLFQQILTADSRMTGWSDPYHLHIYEVPFADRQSAENAFQEIQPHYNDIWKKGVWAGIEATTGNTCHNDKTSADGHLWVDENKNGFSLCVLFSNTEQRNEILDVMEILYEDNDLKYHALKVNESEIRRIRRLQTATHSVEMDVSNDVITYDIVADFMNVAMTSSEEQKALYVDTIQRDGFVRVKAYFDSDRAAENFKKVADLKVRQPLMSAHEVVASMVAREFPNPIILPNHLKRTA